MPAISANTPVFTTPSIPASAPSSAPSTSGTPSSDRYEGPSHQLSDKAGKKLNWDLFGALRDGADNGDGVKGVHWVEPTAFLGFTHELPGLKIVLEVGADVNEVRARIIESFPEFAQYKFVNQWTRWSALPEWMSFLKRHPVVTFRLDTQAP